MIDFNGPSRRNFLPVASAALGSGIAGKLHAEAQTPKRVASRLPIQPRLQWEELDGYCGECCVQQAALHFGTYVSQFVCRAIINPNQKSQLLVGLNEQSVLSALRMNSVAFDFTRAPIPQFPAYFVWLKQQLALQRPVLITAYARGLRDLDYDHIMLAIGFTADDIMSFKSADMLAFNDCFQLVSCNRTAGTLSDNRRMRGNGAKYEFCIPNSVCYGCAVTGIQDASRQALPVRIVLESSSEPDLMAGELPLPLKGTVSMNGLTVGKSYTLYRFNDYRVVPTTNYAKSAYASAQNFIATGSTMLFPVSIPSNGVAVFRCLPAGR